MKKYFLLLCMLLCSSSCLLKTRAEEITFQDETLMEACEKEELSCNHTEQEINPSLPNIYIFRGEKCTYCNMLLEFLSNIYDNYKDRANFIVFEVKNDPVNLYLYQMVAAKFGDEVTGYPYLVIGTRKFDSYLTSSNSKIIQAINGFINKKEPYDVVKEVLNGNYDPIGEKPNYTVLFILIGGILLLSVGIFIYFKYKN